MEPRWVKRQSWIDLGFAVEITGIPGGDRLRECIQCGTCSAVCPERVHGLPAQRQQHPEKTEAPWMIVGDLGL
jgi:heterodisulfide reductase subunit C